MTAIIYNLIKLEKCWKYLWSVRSFEVPHGLQKSNTILKNRYAQDQMKVIAWMTRGVKRKGNKITHNFNNNILSL